MVFVNFTDSSEQKVGQLFDGPQNSENYSFLGEIDETDPRCSAFYAAVNPPPPDATALAELERDRLLSIATQAMTPILLALQLGNATDEETTDAKKWQAYARSLKAVDLTSPVAVWPAIPA